MSLFARNKLQQFTKIAKCHRSTLNNQNIHHFLEIDEQESANIEAI